MVKEKAYKHSCLREVYEDIFPLKRQQSFLFLIMRNWIEQANINSNVVSLPDQG